MLAKRVLVAIINSSPTSWGSLTRTWRRAVGLKKGSQGLYAISLNVTKDRDLGDSSMVPLLLALRMERRRSGDDGIAKLRRCKDAGSSNAWGARSERDGDFFFQGSAWVRRQAVGYDAGKVIRVE